ncbi:MAG: ABC transporter substrate-binding protein [Gammaproteobacteria bacterium]|jgi:phospholipid transport system substrate-binding protein|nr:ABC transporter substrate-binding protein [Gammaproteobacteria bacterium]MBT7603032.1 ABC transporter substrate-binding protein [Gammaproteobacteria bacterium]
MKKLKLYSLAIFIIPLMILGNTLSYANNETPANVILTAANSLFSDVKANKTLYEDDITSFYKRVDAVLGPIIDFDILIKSIVGEKNYKQISDTQKDRFKLALKKQLIRIYAKTIVEYSSSKITIISTSESKGFYIVKTELSIGQGKPAFQVIYVMKNSSDKWKIVEVVANGLRLVKSLRKSLLPEIKEKGIESVIRRLESES